MGDSSALHSFTLSGSKDDNDCNEPKYPQVSLSATKRKLIEAKERDAYFDREVKAVETAQVVRSLSQRFVSDTLSSALFSKSSPSTSGKSSRK
jgi:hypothetical protein